MNLIILVLIICGYRAMTSVLNNSGTHSSVKYEDLKKYL